ncbi:probable rod shape-determining protein (RodA) [Desulfotalea psychrophila LSv54]|uniref:Peptidoglycan glycosyltransferase RodA n=2 Tax=Desulfotalea psychrophila TaxID=84980 RepID=Q6APB1_DESPS|nr:probable rod shape-determining protein (RodA) [Desulfotalea psychrophila LSv54]
MWAFLIRSGMEASMFKADRRLFLHFDMILLLLVLLVSGIALCNLYSASFPYVGYGMAPWLKQLCYFGVMFFMSAFILCVDYKWLHQINYIFYFAVLGLLILADIIGSSAGGSQRWINLGLFNLQPSEVAKISMVICLASYYARKEVLDGYTLKQLLFPMAMLGLPFIMILAQPDLGTALMLGIIFVSMTMFVNLRWSTYLALGTFGIGAAVLGWLYVLKPYQRQRIETFLHPDQDLMGSGYQIFQSKIAIGSGGYFGKGYGEGPQGQLHFLPERHTDFAFAVLGEEWGFIGTFVFLALYFLMLLWGLYVASQAKDRFGILLAYGVVVLIFWQAVINLFMVLGFLPVVGIPLPLVSYGGSSLLTTCIGLAILMNVRMRSFDPVNHC